jgi:hypothetical protein
MQKSKLEGFINRYALGGEIESVVINSNETSLSVSMISDDKSLLGSVNASNITFPDGVYPIYTTSQLKQLLSVLDDDIEVKSGPGYVQFSDKATKVNYMLAAESVIPKVPDIKKLPTFDIQISLDSDFVSKFIKSKGALTESDSFTFISKNGVSEVILGYSTINTNRISITVNAVVDGDVSPISFSAKYLKQILLANKSSNTALLEISTEGLASVSFDDGEFKSEYFLVQQK